MNPGSFIFTSESASEGHPDTVCEGIADALHDAYLTRATKTVTHRAQDLTTLAVV